jgi:peptide deformylase
LARFLDFFDSSWAAKALKYCENTSFPAFADVDTVFLASLMTSAHILPILTYPDPRLHKVAQSIALASGLEPRTEQLIADMLATMYDAQGIGLAATQVDVHERLIVIDVSEEHNTPLVLINPEILWASPEKIKGDEGCLSVPGVYDGVERSTSIRLRAADEKGNSREIEADGLLAVCIQHEMDHLIGKVFVEYLSPLKRSRIKSKMAKAAQPR